MLVHKVLVEAFMLPGIVLVLATTNDSGAIWDLGQQDQPNDWDKTFFSFNVTWT